MKIGILSADQLNENIIGKFGDYCTMFERLLSHSSHRLIFSCYDVVDSILPADIDECDAYLLTGSKYSAYDKDVWIQKLIAFVKLLHMQRKKLVGICFGHQLIAQALGGLTVKHKDGWGAGMHTTQILTNKGWLKPASKEFSLLYSHQDQVSQLPETAVVLAGNAFCKYCSYQIDKHILTFQGHPEFQAEYMNFILNNRRSQLGEEKYIAAVDSLKKKADDFLVAEWILNFLKK